MENLYAYVFWFNHYEGLWYAIERDTLLHFFGGRRDEAKFMKSKVHSTLVEMIVKKDVIENYMIK